jgi:hypothetical protein|uniref:NET domain-containing protein n=1 Tax=viral metagenome TaxID=1070528 RepID=A0A6C0IW69_9ZZZZ
MEEEKPQVKRTFDSYYRKKLLEKINNIKEKSQLVLIFKIVNRDIGNDYSENKSGIFFNMNLLSNDAIIEISDLINTFIETETENASENTEDKVTYKSYSDNEVEVYNSFGSRLSNQEKSILKKCKNFN